MTRLSKFMFNGNLFDKYIAIVLLSLSVLATFMFIVVLSNRLYSVASILLLISCLIWLKIRSNAHISFKRGNWKLYTITSVIFYVLYVLSLLSVYLRPNLYERPMVYFVFISLCVGVLAVTIFIQPSNKIFTYFSLIKIVIIGLTLSYTQLWVFPELVGVDPWYHKSLVESMIYSHSIPEGTSYSFLPIFHLIIGSVAILTDMPYKLAVLLSVSLCQILCFVLFAYILGTLIFKESKLGLLSSLFLISGNYLILRSFWAIPNSLGACLMLITISLLGLYFKGRIGQASKCFSTEYLLLIIIFMLTLILTHTISTVAMAIFLLVFYVSQKVYSMFLFPHSKPLQYSILIAIMFVTLMFAWWTYLTMHTEGLAFMIERKFASYTLSTVSTNYVSTTPFLEQLLSYLPEFLFFMIAGIGLLYMVSYKGDVFSFSFAMCGASILLISFVAPLIGVWIIQDRWRYLAQVLLAIPFAIGVIAVMGRIKCNNVRFGTTFGLITVLSFLMVISPVANIDNMQLYPTTGFRSALIESELVSLGTASSISDGVIYVDNIYLSTSPIDYNLSDLSESLVVGNFLSCEDGAIIFLRSEIINNPLIVSRGLYRLDYDPVMHLNNQKFCKFYDVDTVYGFSKT